MAIITISRGSYSKGKEVAESVAARLGYTCVSRDVLLEASDRFHIPEVKLVRAIHDAPSILDRFNRDKRVFIAYIRSALTCLAAKDNLVYHGLAGHLLLKGIPHVLKVRINAHIEDRVAAEMKREELTAEKARVLLQQDDEERRKWTKSLYGVDPWDSSLYDLVIHVHKLTVADAVDFICLAAEMEAFRTTASASQSMKDLAIACLIKGALVDPFFDVGVTSDYGNVLIYTKAKEKNIEKLKKTARKMESKFQEINNLEIHEGVPIPPNAI